MTNKEKDLMGQFICAVAGIVLAFAIAAICIL
jgi:hypothetical protein